MKPFRYGRDPLCLLASAAYGVNRWLVPAAWKGAFLRGHFADCLLIPAALPLLLWVQRRIRLRTDDARPRWEEIFLHTIVWAIAAELVGPRLFAHATGDTWDVAAYAAGAVVSGLYWQLG